MESFETRGWKHWICETVHMVVERESVLYELRLWGLSGGTCFATADLHYTIWNCVL